MTEMKRNLKVVGLKVEKYIDSVLVGFNCHFDETPEELTRYTLLVTKLVRPGHTRKFTITLSEAFGECGSGWTTASWGIMKLAEVDHFGPFSHRPKQPLYLADDIEGYGHKMAYVFNGEKDAWDPFAIHNEVFTYSANGGDEYYPAGSAFVDLDLFEELPRAMSARPVWIIKGKSGLGKSTLGEAMAVGGQTVFETDSVDELPDTITASVVVLGNRSGFTVDDVKSRLFGTPKVILVDFTAA